MLVHIVNGLHETLDRSFACVSRLLLCDQKAGLPFFQVCVGELGTRGLTTARRWLLDLGLPNGVLAIDIVQFWRSCLPSAVLPH